MVRKKSVLVSFQKFLDKELPFNYKFDESRTSGNKKIILNDYKRENGSENPEVLRSSRA